MTSPILSPGGDLPNPVNRISFSKKQLSEAIAYWDTIQKQHVILYDTDCKGLVCRRQTTNWHYGVQRKIKGKLLRRSLGPVNLKTDNLNNVRRNAEAVMADMFRSVNQTSIGVEDAALMSMTVSQAVEHHFTRKAPGSWRAITLDTYRRDARQMMPDYLDSPIASIAKGEVRAAYFKYQADAPAAANRAVRSLKAVTTSMIKSLNDPSAFPSNVFAIALDGADLSPVTPRDGRLDRGQHGPWYQALASSHRETAYGLGGVYAALAIMYLSGMRKGEALGLTWDEVDGEHDGFITLQPERIKTGNKRPLPWHRPITPEVRKILDEQRRFSTSDFVFESWHKRGTPIKEPRKAFAVVNKRSGLFKVNSKPISSHDLRRTWASAAEFCGLNGFTIRALMNHSLSSVTDGYVGTDSIERREQLMAAAITVENYLLEQGCAA